MIIKDVAGQEKEVQLPKLFKKKWLKALRSEKFKQGRTYLQNNNSYCCLGVACRIVHPKKKIETICYIEESLKTKVPKILRGNTTNPVVQKLTTLNDTGESFEEISNWIEKNL